MHYYSNIRCYIQNVKGSVRGSCSSVFSMKDVLLILGHPDISCNLKRPFLKLFHWVILPPKNHVIHTKYVKVVYYSINYCMWNSKFCVLLPWGRLMFPWAIAHLSIAWFKMPFACWRSIHIALWHSHSVCYIYILYFAFLWSHSVCRPACVQIHVCHAKL